MSSYFPAADECGRHTIFPGVEIRTCAGDRMMVSVVDLAPGAIVEEHSHPHEQVGMLLSGRALFFIGAEQKTLQPGDLYVIPGNTLHKVIALDAPVRALDVFHPVRAEYR